MFDYIEDLSLSLYDSLSLLVGIETDREIGFGHRYLAEDNSGALTAAFVFMFLASLSFFVMAGLAYSDVKAKSKLKKTRFGRAIITIIDGCSKGQSHGGYTEQPEHEHVAEHASSGADMCAFLFKMIPNRGRR
jgi:hypothetical protein